jgi:hypothetical protein
MSKNRRQRRLERFPICVDAEFEIIDLTADMIVTNSQVISSFDIIPVKELSPVKEYSQGKEKPPKANHIFAGKREGKLIDPWEAIIVKTIYDNLCSNRCERCDMSIEIRPVGFGPSKYCKGTIRFSLFPRDYLRNPISDEP